MVEEQNEPIMDGHDDATEAQKLDGVIQQIRGDAALGEVDDVRRMARDRLEQAGLPAGDSDVDAVVSAVGEGGVG